MSKKAKRKRGTEQELAEKNSVKQWKIWEEWTGLNHRSFAKKVG